MIEYLLRKLPPSKETLTEHQLSLAKQLMTAYDPRDLTFSDRLARFLNTGEGLEIINDIKPLQWDECPALKREFFQSLNTRDSILLIRIAAALFSRLPEPSPSRILTKFWNAFVYWGGESRVHYTVIEQMLAFLELPSYAFVKEVFTKNGYLLDEVKTQLLKNLIGIEDSLLKHQDVLGSILLQNDSQRDQEAAIHALKLLPLAPVPILQDAVIRLSLAGPKKLRGPADELIEAQKTSYIAIAYQMLESKSANDRAWAVETIGARLDRTNCREPFRKRLEIEKSKQVREALEEFLSTPPPEDDIILASPTGELNLDPSAKLSDELVEVIKQMYREEPAVGPRGHGKTLDEFLTIIETGGGKGFTLRGQGKWYEVYGKALEGFYKYATPVQFFRFFVMLYRFTEDMRWPVINEYFTKNDQKDFRYLYTYWRAAELDDEILEDIIFHYHAAKAVRKLQHKIWPMFFHSADYTLSLLSPSSSPNTLLEWQVRNRRDGALRFLPLFPSIPNILKPTLWGLAMEGLKEDRIATKAILDKTPDCAEMLMKYVRSSNQEVRLRAAQWIAKSKYKIALPVLEEVLKKEKSEPIRSALLNGIEAVGGSLSPYLNREKLNAEAKSALTKPIPQELSWLPWDVMPVVRWSDTGEIVSVDILKYFLVQSLKLAQYSAIMRRHTALMVPADRAAFAQFVLAHWMNADDPLSYEEALPLARIEAQGVEDKLKKEIAANAEPALLRILQVLLSSQTVEERAEEIARAMSRKITGMGSASKGVLQVVGACAGPEVVQPTLRYMKKWFGYRVGHCKALLNMLAMIDHRSAIQSLLSVRNRFRTKSIQEEADRLAQELADQKGWSVDEMADRTIPDAGFDEKGQLELSYGPRTFTVKLGVEFAPVLVDSTGRELKSLPTPAKTDDEEMAEEAKQEFATAKKELKALVSLQKDRLYEAMCSERTWTVEVWEEYLVKHPIVGRMTQWLVWAELENGKVSRLLRPFGDGTYTDAEDNEIKLQPHAVIKLAHSSLVSERQNSEWIEHLENFNIVPLFLQFGFKSDFTLSGQMSEGDLINDREGHIVESFKLRSCLMRLGYTRGAAQDAGAFYHYEKRLIGLGIQASISFSGLTLPETNCDVALNGLTFHEIPKSKEDDYGSEPIALQELPKIFLAECWSDYHQAAAAGTGFDSNWKEKSPFI